VTVASSPSFLGWKCGSLIAIITK